MMNNLFKILIIVTSLMVITDLSARYQDIPVTRDLNPEGKYNDYAKYIESHPPKHTQYSEVNRVYFHQERDENILIIVESDLYPEISESIEIYQDDLANEEFNSFLIEYEGTSHEDLKFFIMLYFEEEAIVSVVLIGDLPIAWFEMFEDWNNNGVQDEDEGWVNFPIDLYFSDVDGNWQDTDLNGIYDYHESEKHPEIGIGRIIADNMTFLSSSESELINSYFQRNHLFRNGFIQSNNTSLAYIDDDWAWWGDEYQSAMELAFPDVELVHEINETNASDYRNNRLSAEYEFIQVHVHSGPDAHYFYENDGNDWNTVTNYQFSYLNPDAHFYNLFACSNSRFTVNNNMGGMYLFGNEYCLGTIGSTKTGSMLWFEDFYFPLSIDENLGEALRQWWELSVDTGDDWMWERSWFYGMVIQGDPTLKLNYQNENVVFVPDDYPTIQTAIDSVDEGYVVLVNPGTYVENINFNGKNLVVASMFYATGDFSFISQTIIDGDREGNVVTFENNEDSTALLTGFTIMNSSSLQGGGIVCINNSNPRINNVIITDNSASSGGGVYCVDSDPDFNCVIIKNSNALLNGGGMYLENSSPTFVNSLIENNSGLWSGGIYCENSNPVFINTTITQNTGESGGTITAVNNSNPILINSILWENLPAEIYFSETENPNSVYLVNSAIQGGEEGIETNDNGTVHWLDGNIDENPLFLNPDEYDFHLQDISPCIGSGINEIEINGTWFYAPEFDIEGNPRPAPAESMPDMGAYENPLGEPQTGTNDYELPSANLELSNYPNPFNPFTTIQFTAEDVGLRSTSPGQTKDVEMIIYNIKGQKVKIIPVILSGVEGSGQKYSVTWNGTNDNNQPVSSGIYFYKLRIDGCNIASKKMLLMK